VGGGIAGSHVVIRSDVEFHELDKGTLQDAAVLALKYSKGGNKNKVTLTRCRNIVKPRGAAVGAVMIVGDTKTLKVDLNAEKDRLLRLDAQVGLHSAIEP
jgi:predicted ribosome quality control (RQC) complex YloA/Tae2 family protein